MKSNWDRLKDIFKSHGERDMNSSSITDGSEPVDPRFAALVDRGEAQMPRILSMTTIIEYVADDERGYNGESTFAVEVATDTETGLHHIVSLQIHSPYEGYGEIWPCYEGELPEHARVVATKV